MFAVEKRMKFTIVERNHILQTPKDLHGEKRPMLKLWENQALCANALHKANREKTKQDATPEIDKRCSLKDPL